MYAYEVGDDSVVIHVASYRARTWLRLLRWCVAKRYRANDGKVYRLARRVPFGLEELPHNCTHRKIGLPCDGETYAEVTYADAADTLEILRRTGYKVPQRAIDWLREDASSEFSTNN